MAVEVVPTWETLPRETRDVIEWATACERTSRDVGTRALLIGILRAGGGRSPADVLLRHFGISHSQLFQELQRPEPVIDPAVPAKASLTELPPLTRNAQRCLIRAEDIWTVAHRPSIDPACVFGAIMQSHGSARSGLARVLVGVSLDEVAGHYLKWLAARFGSYAEALAEQFPVPPPAESAAVIESNAAVELAAEPLPWPHLAILLRRRTAEGSPFRAAGLGFLVGADSLLTTLHPSTIHQALLADGTQELKWTSSADTLNAARLASTVDGYEPPAVREQPVGGTFRYFVVADNSTNVTEMSARLAAAPGSEVGQFSLVLTTDLPPDQSPIGSPVLDSDNALVGIVEGYVGNTLRVVGIDVIEQFLATLGVPERTDAPPAVLIGNSSGAGNDTVADTDQLGFDVYVKAFADLIRSEYTQPPLTIGIFGSWGMGKSFLLKHIRDAIEKGQDTSAGPRVHSVSFNAWEYSATDAIWPALVRKVVTELDQLSTWPRWKRVWTRLRWNLRREWRSVRTRLVTAGLVLATVVAVAVGKHGLAVGLGGLTALLGIGGLVKAANDPVAKWVTGLFAGSDYGGQLGLMEDIKHDLEELERRLHVDGDPSQTGLTGRILVIIDDLDRCEPAKAVEVLQAVNLLLNFPSFIICLGIDARIITAAVEKHYEGLLGVAGASGYEYLDKIVQIPFRIPEPSPVEVTAFIRSQLAVPPDPTAVETPTGDSAEADLSGQPQPGTWTEAAQLDAESERLWPVAEAPTMVPAPALPDVLFTLDELSAFQLFVPYLRPNPRHLKRLINVYRLVRSLGLAEGERLVLDRPAAVLRWLIMWAQWPLTSSMLLRRLDSPGTDPGQDADPMLALLGQVERSIDRKARADRDDDPTKLRGLLEVPDCVLSVDEIRRIRRYTVNFNPAIEEQLRGTDSTPSEVSEPA